MSIRAPPRQCQQARHAHLKLERLLVRARSVRLGSGSYSACMYALRSAVGVERGPCAVSYTHLRAHETSAHL
eukprot:11549360-Alexandrium_andersonii.AAC.1